MGVSLDKSVRSRTADVRPAPEIAPVPTAGSKGMSLKLEIQPATNPTSEKERVARLADPGFGRITRTALSNRTIQLGLHLYF